MPLQPQGPGCPQDENINYWTPEQKIEMLERELSNIKESWNNLNERLVNEREALKTSENNYKELSDQFEDLNGTYKGTLIKLAQTEKAYDKMEADRQRLLNDWGELTESNQILKTELEAAHNELSKACKERNEAFLHRDQAKASYKNAANDLLKVEGKLHKYVNQITELEAENLHFRDHNKRVNTELESTRRQLFNCGEELKKVQHENHVLKQQVKDRENLIECKEEKIRELTNDIYAKEEIIEHLRERGFAYDKKNVFAEMLFKALFNTRVETRYIAIHPFVCELSDKFNAIEVTPLGTFKLKNSNL